MQDGSAPEATFTELEKKRFLDYVRKQVMSGLTGRDNRDLVDVAPSRAIFAGVLRSIRPKAEAQRSLSEGTAIGLDFRIAASGGAEPKLTIEAEFAVYYPVFPRWEQIRVANSRLLEAEPRPEPAPNPEQDLKGSAERGLEEPSGDEVTKEGDGDDTHEEREQPVASASAPSQVTLPVVFRRLNVAVKPVVVPLTSIGQSFVRVGESEIGDAIATAVDSAKVDGERWRYIGKPESRGRTIGTKHSLEDKNAFEAALTAHKKSGKAVELPQWRAALEVECSPDPASTAFTRLRVLFSNETLDADESVPDRKLEEHYLFDARIRVTVHDAQIVPFEFSLAPKDYRYDPVLKVKGINCAGLSEGGGALYSETLPVFEQPLYRTRESASVPFSDLRGERAEPTLNGIAGGMRRYLDEWTRVLQSEPLGWGEPQIQACTADREAFRAEVSQFELGVECLRRDERLRTAFDLTNAAFEALGSRPGSRTKAWRLFQVGFIVSQLPALAVRELAASQNDEFAQRVRSSFDEVGVLWAPTGAGKTEAYLGLLSVALLYDRLRGKKSGVCAWMRFPLRMLSLQQLERLAKVIAALNELRETEPRVADGDPFAIGYYVGGNVTPNRVSQDEMRLLESTSGATRRGELRLLRKCPHCDSRLEVTPLRQKWRVAHVCGNAKCFTHSAQTLGAFKGTVPIAIVDREIYRYLPSVLLGTVDKLAIAGFERLFAHVVRGARSQCPEHGYTSYNACVERYEADCKRKGRELLKNVPYKDPGPSLLVQDELHLLNAELGVFDAHYEGLLKYLGRGVYMPPKVLAATATIEAYERHAFHLYLSKARRFPTPAWEAGESFYATSRPRIERRTYVGVLAHTRGVEDPAIRIIGLYLQVIRGLKRAPAKVVEVIGRAAPDHAIQRLLRLYDLGLAYVNKKATAGALADRVSQMERYFPMREVGEVTAIQLTGDQTADEVGGAIERIEKEAEDTGEKRLDLVAATSLISHGIDLERINLMVVCGTPSQNAMYVQSSSRAARSHPGLVFSCFTAANVREHSQYEFFFPMHEHMDRLIEPVAVNRFASFAPDKTIPGLLLGILLSEVTPRLFGNGVGVPLDDVGHLKIALGLEPSKGDTTQGVVTEDELRVALEQIIGVDAVRPPASRAQIENIRRRVGEILTDLIAQCGRSIFPKAQEVWKPLTSFRDVDEGVEFGSSSSAGLVARLRAR
jgi:hypothetical protein